MRPRIALMVLVLQRYFVRGGSEPALSLSNGYPPRMGEIAVFGAVGAETHRAKCLCSVVVLFLSFCLTCGVEAGAETAAATKDQGFGPPSRATWAPLPDFTDEFEGNRLDPAKWHDHNPQWKGRKPALFRPSNVRVEGGKLHLTMRCEDVPGAPDGYHTFTSAAVKSKATVRYGYFEIKARPMASRGSSAFWFYNSHDPKWWTEIDVFEIGGGAPKHKRTVHMNVHVFRTPTEKRHWSKAGQHKVAFDLADGYHVYGLEWDKDRIAFYFDGKAVRTLENTHWHQPLYLNFDSETMPNWFGLPEKNNLPSAFSIEYIRAWKKIADEKDKVQETAKTKGRTK